VSETNLVSNPNFELPIIPTEWLLSEAPVYEPATIVTTPIFEGTKSLSLPSFVPLSGPNDESYAIAPLSGGVNGEDYLIDLYANAATAINGSWTQKLRIGIGSTPDPSGAWTYHSLTTPTEAPTWTFLATLSFTYFGESHIIFRTTTTGSGFPAGRGFWYVDRIRFRKV